MNEVIARKMCTGCANCKNICKNQAISMEIGDDGFLYPIIDLKKCTKCGLCRKKCPVITTRINVSLNKCYVAYSKSDYIRLSSSSGGIFTHLANEILKENGIVIGAAFDDDNKLKHIAITDFDDLEKLKGSKYIQSDISNIFQFVKSNIQNKRILFVGTPCQVAGLKAFIKDFSENLICVDIVCHGTPSPKLFSKYISELEKKNGKLLRYNFRDKSTGWELYSNSMIFRNKKISERYNQNDYMKLFLSDVALRECCYNCKFKLGNKYSDLTLGDFWGVGNFYSEMYDAKGVSCIIINTTIGESIFEKIKDNLVYKECKMEEIIAGNPYIKESCVRTKERDTFYGDIDKLTIKQLTKKYSKIESAVDIKNRVKRFIKSFLSGVSS